MKTQYKNRLQYSYRYHVTIGSNMSAGTFLIVLVRFVGRGKLRLLRTLNIPTGEV